MSKVYNLNWERLRRVFLAHNRWCVHCQKNGKRTRSQVVDHITPHKGNKKLFWDQSNWQALCRKCHDGHKRTVERRGFARGSDAEGRPIDPSHPWNDGVTANLKPSAIPVKLIVGPPAAGKTTYALKHMRSGDILIDFDLILKGFGYDQWTDNQEHVKKALAMRNTMLRRLASVTSASTAWVTMMAPSSRERKAWKDALGALCEIVHIDTPIDECRERLYRDPSRRRYRNKLLRALNMYEIRRNG